jgi:hypothetical protein
MRFPVVFALSPTRTSPTPSWYVLADPALLPCFLYGLAWWTARTDSPFGMQGVRVSLEHDCRVGAWTTVRAQCWGLIRSSLPVNETLVIFSSFTAEQTAGARSSITLSRGMNERGRGYRFRPMVCAPLA